ncbi:MULTISPECIES: hypothetical protein [unclassified Mesobacillus]|uniref:hypothetical protein n=1 Tax=unclassified Mesobacillus TaxID=2675270 RepID=UPI00203DCC8B|nr:MULTISPECIES: hypothetical protein [unclassified Mesobacillus]MCM3125687.1 hypothetical protein [Mesobacillus sp. MER 33]MCM3235708.1 hypothetical protein [Mesobacillus sp. MER 48]
MNNIDRRNRLGDEPFSFRVTKDNTVFLDYYGRKVKILKGTEAEKFLKRINAAENSTEEQIVMAKITGNFKRGNERKN